MFDMPHEILVFGPMFDMPTNKRNNDLKEKGRAQPMVTVIMCGASVHAKRLPTSAG